jgi:hypothetical protein
MMVGLLLLHLLLGLKLQNAHGETSWMPHDCKEFSCEACERWCSWSAGLAGCPAQRQIMRCLKAVEPGESHRRPNHKLSRLLLDRVCSHGDSRLAKACTSHMLAARAL